MIVKEDIIKAARLAKLKFDESDITKYTEQLATIMQMVQQLREVETEGVAPLTSVHDFELRLREDTVTERDLGANLFANAPGKDAAFAKEIKCFIVPKVME